MAPLDGDRRVLRDVLKASGFEPVNCRTPVELDATFTESGHESILFVVVTHEGSGAGLGEVLSDMFISQPTWSNLPVIFLVSDSSHPPPGCVRFLEVAGQPPVIMLDRPVAPSSLRSVFEFQARARQRQYETRDLIGKLEDADRFKEFLLSELRHRTRNSLSVLQSMFRLTAARHTDLKAFSADFTDRLNALVKANARLTSENSMSDTLEDLLREHISPYCIDGAQLRLDGPRVSFSDRMSFDLAVVIHELATNASKYGGLSAEKGGLSVTWTVDEDSGRLTIDWKESGGPEVGESSRRGLGSQLIENFSAIPGVEAKRLLEQDGLRWRATISRDAFSLVDDD